MGNYTHGGNAEVTGVVKRLRGKEKKRNRKTDPWRMDALVEGSKGPCKELAKSQLEKVYERRLGWCSSLGAKRRKHAAKAVRCGGKMGTEKP